MFSAYAYCIKDSSHEGAKIGPIQSPCEVPLKCLRFLKAKLYSSLITMWSFSNWLTWEPLFRFFFVRIARSSHIRNFNAFALTIFSVADGLTALSSDVVRPKHRQNHNHRNFNKQRPTLKTLKQNKFVKYKLSSKNHLSLHLGAERRLQPEETPFLCQPSGWWLTSATCCAFPPARAGDGEKAVCLPLRRLLCPEVRNG